jgi:hypothetical protein
METAMKETFTKKMADGPQLYSFRHKLFFFGAYHLLTFTEQDQGKTLQVTVDSDHPICWVELWPAVYNGHDWVRWTTERGDDPLVRTGDKPQMKPSLTWKIVPGAYTLYFVKSSFSKKVSDESVTYHIEIV